MKKSGLGLFALILLLSSYKEVPVADLAVVNVNLSKELGRVSPHLMGFNIVYCYEGDAQWQNGKGKVPEMMSALGTKQFRYPGGTVVTRYHWQTPTGQGWKDLWDKDFDPSKNTSPSTFMDIDEYLELTKKQKTEPLVGINMGSGMKHGRVQDGVKEAVELIKHCLAKGVKVKYYYLDNEPYQHDANYTFKPEEYAEMINLYVPAMKKVDPDIKIIVNTQPRTDVYIKPLLALAGKNIDLVDVHMYWKFKNASFENWKKEEMMTHQGKGSYAEQKTIWEKVFSEAGYPNIKLCVLEWNIGPPGENLPPTEPEAALMVSEQFAQFIKSGLFMSCFWPVSWPDKTDWTSRAVFQAKEGYRPNQMYRMFLYYKDVMNQQQVESTSDSKRLINLAVKSNDGKKLWVYIINKDQVNAKRSVAIKISEKNAKMVSVESFNAAGEHTDTKAPLSNMVDISSNSFVKLTYNL